MHSATLEMFDAVRAVLNGRAIPESERRELAMRLSETAAAFRKRTDRAVRYARLGLRLEAASEAEAEPTLFELAQYLDTEEMHNWRSLCARQQWPVPEVPDPAAVAEIEEAIAQLKPLRRHLARMRLLVLSDAGPWERLLLLRELIERDADNPAWTADMQALEPVAATWLADRCEHAIRHHRLDEGQQHLHCLENGQWQTLVTDKPLHTLRRQYEAAVALQCQQRAPAIVDALEAEWSAQSERGVAEQLANWRALEARSAEHRGALPEALAARAEAAEQWLTGRRSDEEARREHADRAQILADMVDRGGATLQQLRSALAAAEGTVEGCPEETRRSALEEIARLEARKQARRTVGALLSLVAVAAVVAGVWYGIAQSSHSSKVQALADAIVGAVGAQDLDAAARHLAEADKDFEISGDQRVRDARRAYMQARSDLARGDRDFDALMAAAGDPDSADAISAKVDQASALARTEAQQMAVSEWMRLNKRAVDARASERARALLAELKELSARVASLSSEADDAVRMAALSECETRVESIARAAQGNAAVMGEVERARTLVQAQRATMQSAQAQRSRAAALRALAGSAADATGLRLALERFSTEHQGTPEAAAVAEALMAAPFWPPVAEWSAVARGRDMAGAGAASQQERDALAAALRAFAASNPSSPNARQASALAALLAPAEGWRQWLGDKVRDLPEFSYYSIELKDGTRYYLLQDPARLTMQTDNSGRNYRVASILSSGGLEPKIAFQRIDDAAIKSQGPSAQSALAAAIRPLLDANEENPGAANGVQAAFAVLAKLRDTDAVDGAFAAGIARRLLESLATELPAALQAQVQAAAKAIVREKPDGVDWIGGTGGARDRSRAFRAQLRDVLKVEQWRKAYNEMVAAAAEPLAVSYLPVGMLLGAPTTLGPQRELVHPDGRVLPKGAELLALRVGVGKEPSALVRVGQVAADGNAVLAAEASAFPIGTLVFARGSAGP